MKRSSDSKERVRKHRALKKAFQESQSTSENLTSISSELECSRFDPQNEVPTVSIAGCPDRNLCECSAVFENSINDNIVQPSTWSGIFDSEEPSDISINDSIVRLSTSSGIFDSVSVLDEDPEPHGQIPLAEPNLTSKLREWALKYINVLTHEATTSLLELLRSEGLTELPKCAVTLLKTKGCDAGAVKLMLNHRGSYGEFVYFGIEEGLRNGIDIGVFSESIIELLFNIDGLPIYKSSSKEFWPILAMVYNKNYKCKPFIVALYCGDSKPANVNEYLEDFVAELDMVITNGITISGKYFSVSVKAFVCDTPARSFVKCTKGHGGFCACERCEVIGETVNRRRVYSDADSRLRTADSFRTKRQRDHHISTSPLEKIRTLNLVFHFVLDYMHLLCLGIMKTLLLKLIFGDNRTRLHVNNCNMISRRLEALREHIPLEFQRKPRGLKDLKRWKATEFRYVLLYAEPIIFKGILPSRMYKHFLLVHVASRILCDAKLAYTKVEQARELLQRFFLLMPHIYGKDSQTMNIHNLIHLCDDVERMGAPLDDFSAFPFENYLGTIKKLVRTPNKPLAQVCRRLSEIQAQDSQIVQHHQVVSLMERDIIKESVSKCDIKYKKVYFKHMILTCQPPNNLVILKCGTIIEIINILQNRTQESDSIHNRLYFEGYRRKLNGEMFTYPCNSSVVSTIKLGHRSSTMSKFPDSTIAQKLIKLQVKRSVEYATAMLHTQ